MSTKIKSHRIEDGAVSVKHLSRNIKIPETLLSLNHSTHSNAADLTVEQKNTMTMGGNADHLHYHTGGGGGPQGIYTNQERDAQILKLSMMVNADIFGLDKAIVDNLNDDSSIYRGYKTANPPILTNITDGNNYIGTLGKNKEYSYGVSYKNRHGATSIFKMASINTENGESNSVHIKLADVPSDNKGVSIYRANGSSELQLVDELSDSWNNPHGLLCNRYAQDKTSDLSSSVFTYDTSVDSFKSYVSYDLQAVPGVSVPLGEIPSKNIPFDYFIISNSRSSFYGLEILWGKTESFAPRDYEVYYTTDAQILDFEKANWKKFSNLAPLYTTYKTRSASATDGEVIEDYKITNNTRPENKFTVSPINGVTYIRIRVTKIDNICKLTRVNLTDSEKAHTRPFYLDTQNVDVTPFNTIKFDYKTVGQHISFQVEGTRADEEISNKIFLLDTQPTSYSSTLKELRDGYIIARTTNTRTIVGDKYNRVRIGLRVAAQSDVLAENFYLRLATSGSYVTPGSGNIPFYNIPITFDGKPYLKCNYDVATVIWSDWVYLPVSKNTIAYPELVFKSIRGQFMYSTASGYVYMSADDSFLGKENNNSQWFSTDSQSSKCMYCVEFGVSNSVSMNISNGFTHSKWHKGYLDITSVNSMKYLKFFTGEADSPLGSIVLDNFKVTKNKNILGPTVSSTTDITSGAVSDIVSDDFGLSKYKQVSFNRYATVENPQVVAFTFNEPHVINQINLTCLYRDKTPTNYVLQFSTDESAAFDDPLGSSKWLGFTHVSVGESSFDIGFNGVVSGSRIIANNLCNTVVAHRFDDAEVLKVRVWIEGTVGGDVPFVDNIEIYTSEDSEEMKLIYESSDPIDYPVFEIVDSGFTGKDVTPPTHNTTGSYNILWNKDKCLVEIIDNRYDAVLYTNNINLNLFKDFMLTSQHIGGVLFEASFDDGDTFVPVELDTVSSLPTQSDSIIIKAILKDKATLHAFAMLYSL